VAALALAGAVVLAAAGVLTAFRLRPGLWLQAAGMVLLGVAGALALAGDERVGAAWRAEVSPALGLDALSGFFLALLALTAVPTLLYAGAYLRSRVAGLLLAAFLLSLTGLLAARDVSTFLAFWELMTLAPAAAILVARRDAAVRRTVQAYVAITHLGGAGVWIALLALGTGEATLVAVAALIGFGTKAGLVPLHTWLPRAHPVAPAPFSALMSGLMVKVALYGLIRVQFEWLGSPPRWLGVALLVVGLASALGGALWALVQHDLKRLLAYSTIENVGIAAVALGAAVLIEDPLWSSLAFAAALVHIAGHALGKVLLFLGAGMIERATGTLDLDRLGGLGRRLPWGGAAFGVGCASLAGVPLLAGFASEWLTLQSLAHLTFDGPRGLGVAGAAALAGVAATAGLALLCFAGVLGLTVLGAPREEGVPGAGEAARAGGEASGAAARGGAAGAGAASRAEAAEAGAASRGEAARAGGEAAGPGAAARGGAARAGGAGAAAGAARPRAGGAEAPAGLRAPLVALAALCVALGVFVAPLVPHLAALAPNAPDLDTNLNLGLPGTGSLPLPALVLAIVIPTVVLAWARGRHVAATAPSWACGQPLSPALHWSAAAFSKPLRLIAESLLRPRRTLEVVRIRGVVQRIRYGRVVVSPGGRVYGPLLNAALDAARHARRLQTGNLRTYAAYLLGLVLGLLALTGTGALG